MTGPFDIAAFWGELAALGTASCWTLASIFFTLVGRKIGAFNLNKLRIPVAVVCLGGILAATGGFAQIGNFSVGDYGWLALSGIIGLVLGDSCYFGALVILGPRRATLLMSAAPVMAALLAWPSLGEHLGWIAWTGIFVTLGGIAWVTAEREFHTNNMKTHGSKAIGVLLGLGGAAGQAIGLVIAKKVLVESEITPLLATFARMVAAGIIIWGYATVRGQIGSTFAVLKERVVWLAVTAGAVLGPFIGVWLSLVSVKHIEAGVAATIMATVPVLVLPMVVLVYRERVSVRAVLGAIVAVGGVAMLFLR
jgi:drug/metabolite transporter (DMT)-like permease